MEDDKKQSEWNQQQDFAGIYFGLTRDSKNAQALGYNKIWSGIIFAKLSMAMGICKKDEEKLNKLLDDLLFLSNNSLQKEGEKVSIKLKGGKIVTKKISSSKHLFNIETTCDQIVNNKMPFLNIKKKIDMDDI